MERLASTLQPYISAVTDQTHVAEIRRHAEALTRSQKWTSEGNGKLALVITEAATNLLKYAQLGEIHIQLCSRDGVPGIEVLALDRGPGIAGVEECLRDGYSTSGTAGTGLGAIRRLSDEFDIYSQAGKGTVLVARLFAKNETYPSLPKVQTAATFGAVHVPVRGEQVSGDDWGWREVDGRMVVVVADGLGHGPDAATASKAAVDVLERATEFSPASLVEKIHGALRSTRGAAVAVASVGTVAGDVRYCGLGNISGILFDGDRAQHLVSHNGTAGHNMRKLQEFTYAWPRKGFLLMHSDGITTSWRLDVYPGLALRHPTLLSAVLYRDASRGRDDACVIVAKPVG